MYSQTAFVFLASLLLQSSFSDAQSVTAAASSAESSSSSRKPLTRTIDVAKAAHSFTPNVVQAQVGDTVQFLFYPTNHSVVRAAYKHPCVPFELVETDKEGFFSGFHPVDAILEDPPKWELLINDTDPIFFYCSAPGSCINYGMVGVINPNASTSVEVQKNEAEHSSFMLQPGQEWPDESDPRQGSAAESSGSSTSATTSPTATNAPTTTTTAASPATKSSGLSSGAIAGVAIGAAAVALMAGALIYLCGRNRALSDIIRPNRGPTHSVDFESNGVQSVQYIPKHMSAMTMASGRTEPAMGYLPQSPALPGYNGPHESINSPPRAQYAPSDALSPATPVIRSPSPGSMGAPAYSSAASPPLRYSTPVNPSDHGVHEMDAAAQRRNSMNKGGVERYS